MRERGMNVFKWCYGGKIVSRVNLGRSAKMWLNS